MGKRKITGLVKLKNAIYLWRKAGKDKKGDTVILTIRESRTTQEEQAILIEAICHIGFEFFSIHQNNIRFERPGKKGQDLKEVYNEIVTVLKRLDERR